MINFTSLLLALLGLAALIYGANFSLRSYGIKSYSISFGIGHFLFITVMFCLYYFGTRDAQHQLFWIRPETVDLPISLLVQILAPDNMGIYIVLLATLGSFQYAAIGWCLDYKLSQDRKSLLPKRRFIIVSVFVLIGLAYWTFYNVSYLRLSEYEKSEIQLKKAKTDFDRSMALRKAAKLSFKYKKYEKARKYAEELLKLSNENKNDWNIYGRALYDSHIVLGRLQLLDGKSEQAIHHLFEAVKTPGSATLASFGPDMSLAKDLLDKGYKEPVIEFLIGCKRFWKYDNGKVDKWVKEIKEGKIPDFSTNLD